MLGSSEISESGVKVSSRILRRYVLRGEQVEVATRQHWAKLAEPVLTVILGFLIVSYVSSGLERAFGEFGLYLWWVWFGLIARLIWRVFEWRNEWFVATDKRLLLTYGLFTHKVAMMPLGKVTDLNYGRSITGRMLGYGDFTLESAGQDQALRKINWLPSPDQTYRRICDIIFGPERFDSEDSLAQHPDPARPDSDQTDFEHHQPRHPEPPRQRYTSSKIAAEADGGSAENLDDRGSGNAREEEPPDEDLYDEDPNDVDPNDEVDQDEDPLDEGDQSEGSHDEVDPDEVDPDDVDPDDVDEDDVAEDEGPHGEHLRGEDDWQVDSKRSQWETQSGGSDDSWQSSREGAPAYQRVHPRASDGQG